MAKKYHQLRRGKAISSLNRTKTLLLKTGPISLDLLEQVSAKDIQKKKLISEKLDQYQWDYFSSLEYQRSKIMSELRLALLRNAEPFQFKQWQRIVEVKWNNVPLSSKGSLKYIGGRFNIGAIDSSRFPLFPALYIACDKITALEETLGQKIEGQKGLTGYEQALENPKSISVFSISGKLENTLSLLDEKSLDEFRALIQSFEIPAHVQRAWKELKKLKINFPAPKIITKNDELLGSLLETDWRINPAQFNIPANSQIFGEITKSAGIQAILYPSKTTEKANVAIFPENFQGSDSFVKCDDELAESVAVTELDRNTYQKCM